MAGPELSESEVKFLCALSERNVRFLVVGLSAAALQGAPVVTQDVDLWFEDLTQPAIRDCLLELGAAYVAPVELNPPMFVGGGLELFDVVLHMHGLRSFAEEFQGRTQCSLRGARVPVVAASANHREQAGHESAQGPTCPSGLGGRA